MRIRSFIIAYALVLAILLFADRRPSAPSPDRYSHVIDLTAGESAQSGALANSAAEVRKAIKSPSSETETRIIAPAALIPGTWAAGQIPAGRLIAPLVVLDLKATGAAGGGRAISLDDISAWESRHGMIPQGAIVAIRRAVAETTPSSDPSSAPSAESTALPIARDAALFLMEARYSIGFAVETPVTFESDRTLARQLALHGDYVVERAATFRSLPATGSLLIVAPAKAPAKVAPAKNKKPGETAVRVLAMVR